MTTSFITKSVSPDLIITTPAQLVAAFTLWQKEYLANPDDFEDTENLTPEQVGADSAEALIGYLKELNGK